MIKLINFDRKLVSSTYLSWLSDPEIMQFLASSSFKPTMHELETWVEMTLSSSSDYLFSIHIDGQHIGNVKLGGVDQIAGHADIGLIIGNRKYWGKGIGRKVINMTSHYAKNELGLTKLIAGIDVENRASLISFTRENFIIYEYAKNYDLDTHGNFRNGVMLARNLLKL